MNIDYLVIKDENVLYNENDLLKFERLLYESFKNDQWIMNNYHIIDNSRLIPPVCYDDVFIIIAKENNEIIAGTSGIINMKNRLQLEQMGFHIDKNKKKIAEGLNFYITKDSNKNFIKILNSFLDIIIKEIKKRNIEEMYTTCSKDLVKYYELFGFEISEQIELDGYPEFLMKLNI